MRLELNTESEETSCLQAVLEAAVELQMLLKEERASGKIDFDSFMFRYLIQCGEGRDRELYDLTKFS